MNTSMTRLELFSNLGYARDPFATAPFETGDALRVQRILTMAVESRAMVTIAGERGIGKTEAIQAALEKLSVRQVAVTRGEKESIRIGDIETALVLDLAPEEAPKRGGEARTRQVRRIAGEASRKGKVVLVIEEAHRLNSATLRSLKTLREMRWMGQPNLFTVLLIAQSDPMARPGVSEVRLRTDRVQMHGLSAKEAAGYLVATLPRHFDDAAAEAVAGLPAARNFLELQEVAVELLAAAVAEGRESVAAADVAAFAARRESTPLPATSGKGSRKEPAPVSGKEALRNVLGRRSGDSAAQLEAAG